VTKYFTLNYLTFEVTIDTTAMKSPES